MSEALSVTLKVCAFGLSSRKRADKNLFAVRKICF